MASRDDDKDTSMPTAEAGKKGGEKTKETHGPKFYSEIGSKQGKANNPGNFANRPKEEVRDAASKGGQNSHRGDSDNQDQAA